MIRVGSNNLFRVQVAETVRNDALGNIATASQGDIVAKVGRAKAHAALVGVATGPVNKHAGALWVRFGDDIGYPCQLCLGKLDELFRRFFIVHDLADDAHGGNGVFNRVFAKIHIDDGNAELCQLVVVGGVFCGGFGLDVHQHYVRIKRSGLLYVKSAVFKAAKGGDRFNLWEAFGVTGIVVGIRLRKVFAPTDHVGKRSFRFE